MASEARSLSNGMRSHHDHTSSHSPNRRRQSQHLQYPPRVVADMSHDSFVETLVEHSNGRMDDNHIKNEQKEGNNITISSTSKAAGDTVAPFLARHIPEQYNPVGGGRPSPAMTAADRETKFCYRHRPDLKCRRQANEPSMELLQNVSFSFPSGRWNKGVANTTTGS